MSNYKVAFYIRCSDEEQDFLAIKNQEHHLRYDLEMKNRSYPFGQLVEIFVDKGSTKNPNRPALQKMLMAIELGEVNMVMMTEQSRLSRDLKDLSKIWDHLKSFKCDLISLRERSEAVK